MLQHTHHPPRNVENHVVRPTVRHATWRIGCITQSDDAQRDSMRRLSIQRAMCDKVCWRQTTHHVTRNMPLLATTCNHRCSPQHATTAALGSSAYAWQSLTARLGSIEHLTCFETAEVRGISGTREYERSEGYS